MQENKISVGISLPTEFLKQIDEERGDIPRSRYITKLLKTLYPINKSSLVSEISSNEPKDF